MIGKKAMCTRIAVLGCISELICTHFPIFGYISTITSTRKSYLESMFSLSDCFYSVRFCTFITAIMNKQIHQFRIDVIIATSKFYFSE